jgi:hypothetical protein
MINAAITPGTHPSRVRIKTIKIEPHPRSYTARGGKRMESSTRHTLIAKEFLRICDKDTKYYSSGNRQMPGLRFRVNSN